MPYFKVLIKAALTLLQAPFMLFTQKEHKNTEFLKKLLKALSFFNVQLLRKLQLLDEMVGIFKCQSFDKYEILVSV